MRATTTLHPPWLACSRRRSRQDSLTKAPTKHLPPQCKRENTAIMARRRGGNFGSPSAGDDPFKKAAEFLTSRREPAAARVGPRLVPCTVANPARHARLARSPVSDSAHSCLHLSSRRPQAERKAQGLGQRCRGHWGRRREQLEAKTGGVGAERRPGRVDRQGVARSPCGRADARVAGVGVELGGGGKGGDDLSSINKRQRFEAQVLAAAPSATIGPPPRIAAAASPGCQAVCVTFCCI